MIKIFGHSRNGDIGIVVVNTNKEKPDVSLFRSHQTGGVDGRLEPRDVNLLRNAKPICNNISASMRIALELAVAEAIADAAAK